jgi:hypothetical protein
MPKALNVPWDKIRESVENGLPLAEVSRTFEIAGCTIRQRSFRENWKTPKRMGDKLKRAERAHRDKVAGLRGPSADLIANEPAKNSQVTSTAVDLDALAKDYRKGAADRLFKVLSGTIIAPPRTWKDYDIADRMMRRTLGMDDNEGKSNTIVQLQVVNDRLRTSLQDDIIEGDFVPEPSHSEHEQSKFAGLEPESPKAQTSTPPEDGAECLESRESD